jgi:N-dimethylarginine dimethylaminohydrolase
MYTNYNFYDRLRVCLVGRTWPPEFYDWIKNSQVKETMKRIAVETEEDYAQLVSILEKLQIQVLRPTVDLDFDLIAGPDMQSPLPPMCPGDHMIFFGDRLIESLSTRPDAAIYQQTYQPFFSHVIEQDNQIVTADNPSICAAQCFQFEDNLIYGKSEQQSHLEIAQAWKNLTDKSIIGFHLDGHIDGWFCPVTPGLIISSSDPERSVLLSLFYKTHFKNWKVVQSDPSVWYDTSFRQWKKENSGSWWIPGEDKNQEFIEFVNRYFKNWIGNVSETVFEVNMIVVDEKTVIVRKTNNFKVLQQLEDHGITVYQVPFRHSTFWDAGLNCVTMAVHRSK